MPFDGVFISHLTAELNEQLIGAKIFKIYQPGAREITVEFRFGKDLFVSADASNPYFCLTESRKTNPVSPPNFCMLLRKHLNGGVVKSIVQDGLERSVSIEIEAVNELGDIEVKKLYIEIMGKYCNIILTDSKGKILGAIKQEDGNNGPRTIMPGIIYTRLEGKEKILSTDVSNESAQSFNSPKDIVNSVMGISPAVARMIFAGMQSKSYFETVNEISSNAKPYLFLNVNGEPADFSYTYLDGYDKFINTQSYSEAAERFFEHKTAINLAKQRAGDLLKKITSAIDRIEKKNEKQVLELEMSENSEQYREYGDLLTSNLHLGNIRENSITLKNYYDNFNDVTIELDPSKDLKSNALMYYKKYKKLKTASGFLNKQIEENKKELEYLYATKFFITECTNEAEISEIREELILNGLVKFKGYNRNNSSRIRKSAPLEYKSESGITVLVGKNNIQNDRLTFKTAKKDYTWLHVKDAPGSHTVIMEEFENTDDDTFVFAAELAAKHSSLKGKVSVDYTKIKYVRRQPDGKPGMVFYTDYKTLVVDTSK